MDDTRLRCAGSIISPAGSLDIAVEAAREGLAQTPFFVLLLLKRNTAGLTIGALADGVAVASQTMTRAVKQMEASGLCTRHPDPSDAGAGDFRAVAPCHAG